MIVDGSRQKKIRRDNRIKLLIVATIIIGTAIVTLAVPGLLTSFLLAFAISYLFKPVVNAMERKGIDRTLSILLLFVIAGFLVSAASGIVINRITQQATSFQTDLPKYVTGISDLIKKRTKTLNSTLSPYTKIDLGGKVAVWLQDSAGSLLNKIPDWISGLLSTMILAPFFAFFMLRDGQRISRILLSMVPNDLFEIVLNLTFQINKQLGGFIRARMVEAIIVGFLVWAGLYILGFPYASLLGVFGGITNLIPYIGPIIGAVPAVLIALVNFDNNLPEVGIVGAVYVVAQVVDMLFIIPLLVARIVDLHPVTVVIVVIIGSQILGILGMIISVPLASIIKLTFTEFYNHVVDFKT